MNEKKMEVLAKTVKILQETFGVENVDLVANVSNVLDLEVLATLSNVLDKRTITDSQNWRILEVVMGMLKDGETTEKVKGTKDFLVELCTELNNVTKNEPPLPSFPAFATEKG